MRQNGQNSFCNCLHIWYFYFYINCTTSKVPAIYNFNYVILNYKSTNYFPIDKFSEFCRLGTIDVIHRLVVTNRRFSRIDELCLTDPLKVNHVATNKFVNLCCLPLIEVPKFEVLKSLFFA